MQPLYLLWQHWLTGEQLAGWERALAVLDLVPGEVLVKAGIVAVVVKIGGKVVDVAKLSAISRRAIAKAIQFGSKVLPTANEQFTLIGKSGATIGVLLKEGADDVLRVANDGWLDDAVDIASDQVSQVSSSVVVKDGLGNVVTEAVYMVKKADGTVGFVKAGEVAVDGTKYKWTNLSGKELSWPKQTAQDIEVGITTALNNADDVSKQIEGKVGQYVSSKANVSGFGAKFDNAAGELDVVTDKVIIEVKKSAGSLKSDQFIKFIDPAHPNYLNANNLDVVLYIDEIPTKKWQIDKIKSIEEMGVEVVYSLSDLDKFL
ncbi:hypothetical protein LVD17_08945 [Fulvivirga ulvae]|uniref:hypothetical protein n=1 Tax=Fulvivirga ulvae TaxID=2904245 RepID=UPI001F37FF23|nr:hypothetical protein [Fulvivirga ulvae]UII33940.1 hypothetical protein LVD17_08945 [Fulvivirga ulvae]